MPAVFKSGHGSDERTIDAWIESEPTVNSWFAKIRPSTGKKYAMSLRAYWLDHLSHRYRTMEDWLSVVKKQQFEHDFEVQTAWARELEEFITKRKVDEHTRRCMVCAVQSFLQPRIGKQNARNYKFTYATAEERDSEE